jgi:DNA polymerase III subunit delta
MTGQTQSKKYLNYIYAGQEVFLIEEELYRLKDRLGDGASMNLATYNAEESLNINEVLDLCNTLPFLSERRIITIRNAGRIPEKDLDTILSYLKNPSETTILILTLEGEKPSEKLLKKFSDHTEIIRFDPLKNKADRIRWVMDRAIKQGKKIDKDAATLLADMTGTNMWFIATEIEKLCLYIASRPSITISDVQDLVMRTNEPSIFSFLDSLFEKKKDVLFKLYEIELAGISELEIISRIENQIIVHLQVHTGGNWKKSGVHAFVAEKALARKAIWSPPQLLDLLKEIRDIEQRIKSSSISHVFATLTEVIGRFVLGKRTSERQGDRFPLH